MSGDKSSKELIIMLCQNPNAPPASRTLAVADSAQSVDFHSTAGDAEPVLPSAVASLQGQANSMAFSSDGRTLAIGDYSGDAFLFNTVTRRITPRWPTIRQKSRE